MRGIPLAWQQLTREKRRFAAALAGISFAVTLMMMQLGLRDALYKNATKVHDRLRGDLVVVSAEYEYLFSTRNFSQRRLYSALAVDGVAGVAPLYAGIGVWKNPVSRAEHRILVMGFRTDAPVFDFPEVNTRLREINQPDVALWDANSRHEFGPIAALMAAGPLATEVNERRVHVAGLFRMGPTFGSSGHVITSDLNFLRLFPDRREGLIDMGFITLAPGTDPARARDAVDAVLPSDVRVMTRDEFIAVERGYWAEHLPIGFIFNLGSLMGLIVGGVIVYQILYADVVDHLPEYATLKAMGYSDRHLFGVIAQESWFLSCLGFIPGFLVAQGLYWLMQTQTNIPIDMTVTRVVSVFLLTLSACALSGAIAMRKIRQADPAEVF